MQRYVLGLAVLTCAGSFLAAEVRGGETIQARLDFNRDVRPILSDKCFVCHGPDNGKRKAGLRLDLRDSALGKLKSGSVAVVPGKPNESELVARIFNEDASEVMPPAKSQKKLTEREKQVLKDWIEQGAKYQAYWSFAPPQPPALPKVKDASWPKNPIDAFILARLEKEGLKPSPEADRITLIRRLTFDLTGLPPTPAEVDAFVADTSANAYEKLVDRLLASPRYGERMALEWLDAARYADTHGYHIDSGRDMTRWREWVIDAFNDNMPFDRFTVEQLAGDLLPNATLQQKIASGFNRNHMINFEGGAIPEEYHVAYIVDRINTTGTVWLGLTIGCCQCHDHKFDPISQKEYYQLYAFFHNVPEKGLDGDKGNAAPVLRVPSSGQKQEYDRLAVEIKDLEKRFEGPMPECDAAQVKWEKNILAEHKIDWTLLDPSEFTSKAGSNFAKRPDKSLIVYGINPDTDAYTVTASVDLEGITALRLEALPEEKLPGMGPGRSKNGNIVLTDVHISAAPRNDPAAKKPLKIKSASADFSQKEHPIAHAVDSKKNTGWSILPEVGQPHAAVFEIDPLLPNEAGMILTVTLDFQSQFGQHQLGHFRLGVSNAKTPHEETKLPARIQEILALDAGKRTDSQKDLLRGFYRSRFSPELKQLNDRLAELRKKQGELNGKITTAMVMQELAKPRDTFMLIRGQYDKKGEKVTAGVPASLPPLPQGAPVNRLGLAQWLVDPTHPLVSRVIVNRYWQMYFGTGIVKTSEDFGSQGEWPSHPELLDWLATEFIRMKWDVKAFQKMIVTSAAYRQSSAATSALIAKDPENRLLARGARIRLPAEFIRDQALAVSGLIDDRIGGPSVSPYQPPGLWEELASRSDGKNWSAQSYTQSHGRDLYRRTMYTFWKRTVPPPTLATFDAPDRETCTVRRARTNTPLQALILLNDPTYIEAARKLAERMMTEAGPAYEDRIAFAFRLATARRPKPAELAVLRKLFDQQLAVYRADEKAALKLLSVGESKRNDKLDPAELAAWTMIASTILNLDETITKG